MTEGTGKRERRGDRKEGKEGERRHGKMESKGVVGVEEKFGKKG